MVLFSTIQNSGGGGPPLISEGSSQVNLNVLRIFRVVRLMRAARVVISVPEFYILAPRRPVWDRRNEKVAEEEEAANTSKKSLDMCGFFLRV